MIDRKAFWQGRKVLITGHTGFKGSWLSLWLQKFGADVIGYALPAPTDPNLFEVANVAEGMTSIIGDVRDGESLRAVVQEHKPEVVFHLAAQPIVRQSYEDPVETYSTNVMGTVNILDAVRQTDGVRAVVSITSDKCYQNNEWVWGYRENDPVGGFDPYSSSKGASELVIASFRNSYFSPRLYQHHGVGLASTRAGNVIGGGDWARDRLIPDFMRAIMGGRPVIIRSPTAIRPWMHVLDPLNGYMKVAEQLVRQGADFAQPWNFGPSDEDTQTVSWIVDYLTKSWGEGARWELGSAKHPHEDRWLKLDYSKAFRYLEWSTKLHLSTALEWIVEWYKAYQANEDLHALTLDQIARFEKIEGKI